jgi:HAD superfamily hydrolase (TIGR01509 family)
MIGLPGKEVIALLAAELGARFHYPSFQPIYAAHRDARMQAGIPLKPGVVALLDRAAEADLPLVVATSSGRDGAREKLASAGLLDRFAAVVTRDDVEAPKPHPALFLKAAAAAGHPPSACLAVEDSHVGIRAAHAAGTMPVMVPDMLPCTDDIRALCLHVVPDLHAVRDLLHASLAVPRLQGATP